MIPIERIREQLPGIRRFGPGLVAVFGTYLSRSKPAAMSGKGVP